MNSKKQTTIYVVLNCIELFPLFWFLWLLLVFQYTNLPISRTINDFVLVDPFRGVKKEATERFSFKLEKRMQVIFPMSGNSTFETSDFTDLRFSF